MRTVRRGAVSLLATGLILLVTTQRALAYPADPGGGGTAATTPASGGGWSAWETTLLVAAIVVAGLLLASLLTYRSHHKPRYGGTAPTH